MEKITTITNSSPTVFDLKVNEFVSNKDIVITKVDFQSVGQSRKTVHIAYIFYMSREDYVKMREQEMALKQSQQQTVEKAKPVRKPRIKKVTKPIEKTMPTKA